VCIEHIELSQEERKLYETMQKEGKIIVSKYVHVYYSNWNTSSPYYV